MTNILPLVWPPFALPTLKIVQSHLRPGAVIVVDNTISAAKGYAELLSYVRDPEGPFTTITIPYKDGLELIVYKP